MLRLVIFVFLIISSTVAAGKTREAKNFKQAKSRADSIENYVTFTLYTRYNTQGRTLAINDQVLANSGFSFNRFTKCITHGWNNNITSTPNILQMKDAYLSMYDYNVIIVDWSRVSGNLNETIGVDSSVYVGQYYGNFLNYLIGRGGSVNGFHLVGHGLGAHVSGIAGNVVYQYWNARILRITGLDPTRRYVRRLAANDAAFVDAIHTSIGYYGIIDGIALADFYPNNGMIPQPGCGGFYESVIACSHFKSMEYFTQTIKQENKYLATRCTSYADYKEGRCPNEAKSYMGEAVSRNASGLYFLSTY